jgi:hypothetical protein
MMTRMIKERIEFLAPVIVIPGEHEMETLALGAARLLAGEAYNIYGRPTSSISVKNRELANSEAVG